MQDSTGTPWHWPKKRRQNIEDLLPPNTSSYGTYIRYKVHIKVYGTYTGIRYVYKVYGTYIRYTDPYSLTKLAEEDHCHTNIPHLVGCKNKCVGNVLAWEMKY